MEKVMDDEMYLAHCSRCGYKISKSAPGTRSMVVCPRCGCELEVRVDETTVHVAVLKLKATRDARAAR